MTMPRMEALCKRWRQVPPLSVSVASIAAALGVKLGEAPRNPQNNLQELADAVGAAGMGSGKPDWLVAAEAAEAGNG